jgi:uncharacterized repeat protein (TIGR03847 family)
MPQHIELNPVSHLTIATVGEPGQRKFYLQGSKGSEIVSMVVEKFQAALLADNLEELLEKLAREHDSVAESLNAPANFDMRLRQPLDELFRVGNIGMGFNEEDGRLVIVAYESVDTEAGEEPNLVSFWTTPAHIKVLIEHTRKIVKSGRPICGNCGEPIDPAGHWCAQRNGHKK